MPMNTPKVSIIIPVYNSLKTLSDCIFSLVNQTLPDIEIILVNDCSPDESHILLNAWQERFPDRIKVISTDHNRGAGGARNTGIAVATGEYIGFVDSDDKVEPTMYEKLLGEALRGDFDVVDCGFYNEASDSAIIYTSDDLTGNLTPAQRQSLIVSGGYIWSKIYRRSLFSDDKLSMRENCILEDADFLTYLFSTIKSIGNVKEILYCYCDQTDSLSKMTVSEKYYMNICAAIEAIYEKCSGIKGHSDISPAIEYEILQMYTFGVLNVLGMYKDSISNPLTNTKIAHDETVSRLNLLRNLRMKCVGDKSEHAYLNPFVSAKIPTEDIQICKLNDASPEALLKRI